MKGRTYLIGRDVLTSWWMTSLKRVMKSLALWFAHQSLLEIYAEPEIVQKIAVHCSSAHPKIKQLMRNMMDPKHNVVNCISNSQIK